MAQGGSVMIKQRAIFVDKGSGGWGTGLRGARNMGNRARPVKSGRRSPQSASDPNRQSDNLQSTIAN